MIISQAPPKRQEQFIQLTLKTRYDCSILEYEALLLMVLYDQYKLNPHQLQLHYDEADLQKMRYEILYDHMDLLLKTCCTHDKPMKYFQHKEIFHRPICGNNQCVEATGDVFVCPECGRGHLCTPLECLNEEVCPWSARCRPFHFMNNLKTCNIFLDQIKASSSMGDISVPREDNVTSGMAQHMFSYKQFDGIKLFYQTRKKKKFSLFIGEQERDHYADVASRVVKELLNAPKKQSIVTFKRKKKFYNDHNESALDTVRPYLIKCRAAQSRPNWLECMRLYHLNLFCRRNVESDTITITQLQSIINLLCKILFKLLKTDVGKNTKFDFGKMCVALLYSMSTQGLVVEKVCLIPSLPWIRKYILEQQNLHIVYNKKYNKNCIVDGQNTYKQIVRHLIMYNGYVYNDFSIHH